MRIIDKEGDVTLDGDLRNRGVHRAVDPQAYAAWVDLHTEEVEIVRGKEEVGTEIKFCFHAVYHVNQSQGAFLLAEAKLTVGCAIITDAKSKAEAVILILHVIIMDTDSRTHYARGQSGEGVDGMLALHGRHFQIHLAIFANGGHVGGEGEYLLQLGHEC